MTHQLVACPPMKARLSLETCVKTCESGKHLSCRDCPLGKERGAKGWGKNKSWAFGANRVGRQQQKNSRRTRRLKS